MGYRHAVAVMPRNIARLVNAATYSAPVPTYTAEYVRAMRDRDAREFWDSAVATPVQTGTLVGSRYVGGSSAAPRSAR